MTINESSSLQHFLFLIENKDFLKGNNLITRFKINKHRVIIKSFIYTALQFI